MNLLLRYYKLKANLILTGNPVAVLIADEVDKLISAILGSAHLLARARVHAGRQAIQRRVDTGLKLRGFGAVPVNMQCLCTSVGLYARCRTQCACTCYQPTGLCVPALCQLTDWTKNLMSYRFIWEFLTY